MRALSVLMAVVVLTGCASLDLARNGGAGLPAHRNHRAADAAMVRLRLDARAAALARDGGGGGVSAHADATGSIFRVVRGHDA